MGMRLKSRVFAYENCFRLSPRTPDIASQYFSPIVLRSALSRSNPDVARIDGRQSCDGHRLPPSGFSIGKSICYLSRVRVALLQHVHRWQPLDDVIEFPGRYTTPDALLVLVFQIWKATWLELLIVDRKYFINAKQMRIRSRTCAPV